MTWAIKAPRLMLGDLSENSVFMLAPRKMSDRPMVQARRVLHGSVWSSYGCTAARTSG
jgi:hypothetical protein